jgi:signal transduction histidine kinase/CheY-like chemotaxis protein
VLITVAICGLALWLTGNGERVYDPASICLTLGIGTGLSRLLSDSFYTTLRWALVMQQRADKLLVESQDRAGKLNSTVRSLELTSNLLKRSNRELEIARRFADEARHMKEQFAANISHELRTPLNLILGFSEMMYLSPDVYGTMEWPSSLRGDVYHINQSSAHLLSLIDDILDLSRYEMAQFTLNRASACLELHLRSAAEIAAGLLRGRPIQLEVSIEPGLPALDIDETRIQQVLLNLLSNAQRFTKAGTIRLAAKKTGSDVIISISDTGSGIPADKLPRIFDEFYQVDGSLRRNSGGAGLGLAICKRFVEAHEGRIWVESQEGAGTTFYFSLPVPGTQPPTSYPHLVNPIGLTQPSTRPCVLVVDPDPDVATLISRHIDSVGVVHLQDSSQLETALAAHPVIAVVRNVSPTAEIQRHSEQDMHRYAAPVIECSLPSHAWVAQDLSVTACLTKPITAQQLWREIYRLDSIQDVLIVDDDQGFGQLVERMLEMKSGTDRGMDHPPMRLPFHVRHAYDGRQALRAMRGRRPDLVLLDLAMPSMDGFQTLAQMRQEPDLAGIPVILLTVTSYAEDVLRHRAGRITIEQQQGMQPIEVLRYLQAIIGSLQLSYTNRMAVARVSSC